MEVFSIIIPVYNRPEEIDDLLNSLTRQTYVHFEVIVVDDGSSIPCESVVNAYNDRLRIRYFYIENSGPGLARNQGVRYAEGEIVIVLDSDCIVPASYLEQVHESLMRYKVDAFGGADRAHSSFSAIQKACPHLRITGQLLDDFFLYDRRDPRKPETFGYILSSEF